MIMQQDEKLIDLDLSKITQYDLYTIYPEFIPILISWDETITNEDQNLLRVMELLAYAEHYGISELKIKLTELYKSIYPNNF